MQIIKFCRKAFKKLLILQLIIKILIYRVYRIILIIILSVMQTIIIILKVEILPDPFLFIKLEILKSLLVTRFKIALKQLQPIKIKLKIL